MKVLITGGSGLIGNVLTQKLLTENIPVVHLTRSRNSKSGVKTYEWDWAKGSIDTNCFDSVTHIVHLAGAGIADKPWTMQRKRLIVKSRVHTTRLLRQSIGDSKLEAFISASGIGYYGAISSDKIFTETDAPYDDFIAKCCVQWEKEAATFEDICRVVKLRTGIVLSQHGGAVPKIASSVKRGMGAPLGKGNQFMPWIHIDDIVEMYYQAVTNSSWNGVYNAVTSQSTTNTSLTKAIAMALNKKIWLPTIPAWTMKMIFGEMADLLLYGSQVDNQKVIEQGFDFKYDEIHKAMQSLY